MFEIYSLYHYLTSYFHSISTPHFTTLPYLFHHLYRLHHRSPRGSTLSLRITPSAYRSQKFR